MGSCGIFKCNKRKIVVGIWSDEHELIEAAKKTREAGYKKFDAITPFPLHGIDEAIGIPRSFIPWVTFTLGLTGCSFGVWFTWWTSAVDWPINIGGKPMWSLPAFIPVIFECTILFAALSSVAAMFVMNNLPSLNPTVVDPDLTSHKFGLFVSEDDPSYNETKLQELFKKWGAEKVRIVEY